MMKWLALIAYCLLAFPTWGAETTESEIPVRLEVQKKDNDGAGTLFRIIGSVAIVGLMGTAAIFYLRKYRSQNKESAQMPNIKVLTQHYLGPKKSLALVRVAGESMLIGITDNQINLIKSLSLLDEDVPNEFPANFNQVMPSNSDEDFSMSGIKDFVSNRLKNMRTID